MRHDAKAPNDGVVLAVRCSIADGVFDCHAPAVHTLLRARPDNAIAIEVLSQSDSWRVRGIALITAHGLSRGMPLPDNGVLRRAPVGKTIRSRMRNVFRATIDGLAHPADLGWRGVHRAPSALDSTVTQSEEIGTGINATDVLMPLERGGKAGVFGGADMGKTVRVNEMIYNMVSHHDDASIFFCIGEHCR